MKRIMFLNIKFNYGGAERSLIDMTSALCEKYDITVYSIEGGGNIAEQLNPRVHYQTITSGNKRSIKFRLFYYLYSKRLLKYFYRFFIRGKYDIEVAAFEGVPTYVVSQSPKRTKKIAWVHTDMLSNHGPDAAYQNDSEHSEAYKKYDRIVCVSNEGMLQFVKRFENEEKVCRKYNILDDVLILKKANLPIENAITTKKKFTMVSVGRLIALKGFERLIGIASQLICEGYDFDLWIIGGGAMSSQLQEQIVQHGLQEHVFLWGQQINPYNIMKQADLCVSASFIEAYPTTLIEALILKLPVIATKCAGSVEAVSEEFGWIVENNESSLYVALKSALSASEEWLHYKQKAKEYNYFTLKQKYISELEKVFE